MRRMEFLLERLVLGHLTRRLLYSWRRYAVSALEAAFVDELFRLPGAGFVFQAFRGPADHAIEDGAFLGVAGPWPEAGADRALIVRLDLPFEPIQVGLTTNGREVIAVNCAAELALLMEEYARGRRALSEAHSH